MTRRTQVFAHRGARMVTPENTLPAFRRALEMGVDGIELDVQATSDGVLVILHDYDLSRTTTGSGLLRSHSLAQLQGVDAGVRFHASFINTPIPTLDQVLDLVGDRCRINVEIKSQAGWRVQEVAPVVRVIQRLRLHQQVLVSSFNPAALWRTRQLDPSIPLGILYAPNSPRYMRNGWFALLLAPEAIHPRYDMVTPSLVQKAHRRGQYVNTWTVNDASEARRLAAMGVDVIMSDAPDEIIRALEGENESGSG